MMKVNMWRRQILILLISSIFFTSCIFGGSDLVDITAPQIDVLKPLEWDSVVADGFVDFEATFFDDLELGSYSIDVHDNLDDHGHGRISQINNDPSLERWIFKKNYSIPEGYIMFVAQHNDDIEVPGNAIAGPYHFVVQAVDQAGNATNYQDGSTVEFQVLITNNSQPVVNITNLTNGELEIESGIRFMVEGNVSDPTTGTYAGMHSMEVLLGEDHEEEHDHVHARIEQDEHSSLIDVDYEGSDLEAFMIDGVIQLELIFESIDFTLSQQQLDELDSEGVDYLLLNLIVEDEQGNLTFSRTIVHIHI